MFLSFDVWINAWINVLINVWINVWIKCSGAEREGRNAVRGRAEGVAANVGPRREAERLPLPQVKRQSFRSGSGLKLKTFANRNCPISYDKYLFFCIPT